MPEVNRRPELKLPESADLRQKQNFWDVARTFAYAWQKVQQFLLAVEGNAAFKSAYTGKKTANPYLLVEVGKAYEELQIRQCASHLISVGRLLSADYGPLRPLLRKTTVPNAEEVDACLIEMASVIVADRLRLPDLCVHTPDDLGSLANSRGPDRKEGQGRTPGVFTLSEDGWAVYGKPFPTGGKDFRPKRIEVLEELVDSCGQYRSVAWIAKKTKAQRTTVGSHLSNIRTFIRSAVKDFIDQGGQLGISGNDKSIRDYVAEHILLQEGTGDKASYCLNIEGSREAGFRVRQEPAKRGQKKRVKKKPTNRGKKKKPSPRQ